MTATGRQAGPLERYANNSPTAGQSPRESRYERRGLLWAESSLERIRKCGRTPVQTGGVALRVRDGVAGFAGLSTCSSIWADPVCNAKIMARRALEIGAAVALWQAQGGSVVLLTLTERHRLGEPLGALWDDVAYAWSSVTRGRPWDSDRSAYGVAGFLRLAEVTIGRNGWHPHLHALLFIEPTAEVVDVARLHARVFERWSRALNRRGRLAVMAASDAHLVTGPADETLSAYLTKSVDRAKSIGVEVTWSQSKSTRTDLSTETPWVLLDRIQEGDADALDLWHEWERASRGRRAHTWSQGIRDRLTLAAEKSDEELSLIHI